jgi:hypothetical protein
MESNMIVLLMHDNHPIREWKLEGKGMAHLRVD